MILRNQVLAPITFRQKLAVWRRNFPWEGFALFWLSVIIPPAGFLLFYHYMRSDSEKADSVMWGSIFGTIFYLWPLISSWF